MTPAHLLLLLGALVTSTYADTWTALGCFSRSSVSASSAGTYIYQSSGYCQQECGGKRIAALINGNQCYCGDSDPSDSVDKKYCNKPCSGYGVDMCGGANYFTVYVNSDVDNEGDSDNDNDSSSTTKNTSSSTSTSSSSNKTSSTSSTSSTTSSSRTHTTVVSTITDSEGGEPSVIYKTVVQTPSHFSTSETPTETETEAEETTAAADNNNKNNNKNKNQSKSISSGTIAGAVVGAVAGVGVIAALIFLFVRYRKKKEEDEFDDIFSVGENKNDISARNRPPSDPFSRGGGYNQYSNNRAPSQQHTQRDSRHLSVYGHDYKSSSGTSNGDHIYSDEFAFNDSNLSPPHHPEYGRRKLSTGSLPDMIDRRPGSLKVVNN